MFKNFLKNCNVAICDNTMQGTLYNAYSKLLEKLPLDSYWGPKRGLMFNIKANRKIVLKSPFFKTTML